MKKIVIASSNQGKIAEMKAILKDFSLTLISQAELGIGSAEETGSTFVENAIIKARHAARLSGLPAIADDSGLMVDVLKGAPGVYSARYAGEDANDVLNNEKLLENLRQHNLWRHDLPQPNADKPKARFCCVIVLLRYAEDPMPLVGQGIWEGCITYTPKGCQGFGYDPLFVDPVSGSTAAELESEVKNKISHRAKALEQFKEAWRAIF